MMRDINLTNFFLFFVFWLKILTLVSVMLICARQKQLAVISVEKHPLL